MNLLVFAIACKPSGEAYTLEIDLQLPPNQLSLFDEVDSVELLIETDAGTETYALAGSDPGDRSELIGIDPLDEATAAIVGYSGSEVVAFGRSQVLTVAEGEASVSILVARVDDFAWVDMSQASAFGAVAASGSGSFLLFGGADGSVVDVDSSNIAPLDGVWSLPVAPPDADFALLEQTTLPPMDEETFEYGSATEPGRLGLTATRLADGGGILLTGGSAMYEDQSQTSNAAWVFSPSTNTYTEVSPLSERRMLHTTAVGPTGEVIIIGGFGSAQQNYISPLESFEIYDPGSQTFTLGEGNPYSGMIGAGAARLGGEGVLVCGGMLTDFSVNVAHAHHCDIIGIGGMLNEDVEMEVGLLWPKLVTLDDGVMITGGFIGEIGTYYDQSGTMEATERAWIYQDGTFTEIAPMKNPRAMHAAVPLPDGRVLVAGGSNRAVNYFLFMSSRSLACAEIYDPQTDAWTEVTPCTDDDVESSLPAQVSSPGFAHDPDYGVLIAGGYNVDGDAVDGAAYFVGQPDL